jgi:hypothetical protein
VPARDRVIAKLGQHVKSPEEDQQRQPGAIMTLTTNYIDRAFFGYDSVSIIQSFAAAGTSQYDVRLEVSIFIYP